MRELATFEDERTAKLFADVLCSREIDTNVSRTKAGSYIVWVLEERNVEVARALYAAFDASPEAPEHTAAAGCVDRKHREEEAQKRKSRHEVIDVRTTFRETDRRPAPITLVLIGISISVTFGVLIAKHVGLALLFSIDMPPYGVPYARVLHGEVWRLLTPIFLHYSFLHIFFNMLWLFDLGTLIENRIGSTRFAALVLFTGVLSNVAQYSLKGPAFGGMSGVVYALFGYVWVRGRLDPTTGFVTRQSTVVMLMVWLVLGFTDQIGQMANYAHLGGLIAGALAGAFAARNKAR